MNKTENVQASSLLRWQWDGYPTYHQSRLNLGLHIVAVPAFLAGNVLMVLALLEGAWLAALGWLLLSTLAFALQGVGHKREPNASIPFSSPANAAARILLEQWVTFPRFVLSGGWWRALRRAA